MLFCDSCLFKHITYYYFMKKIYVLAGFFITALMIGAGCASNKQTTDPIAIGFISPLTGDVASVGVPSRQAAELAVEEINAAGGVNGHPLKLIVEDGKCSPKDATFAASKLMNVDRVTAIVGGLCSSETSAFAPSAMQKKVIVFSHGSSAPSLSKTGKYFFRSYPSDALQGKIAAEYAYQTMGARKIAIVFHQTEYGNGAKDVFGTRFKELGGEIVAMEGAPQDARDYRTIVTKVKAANPDIVYAPTYPEGAIVLVKQLREQQVTAKILGGDGWTDTKLQSALVGQQDVYFVQPKMVAAPDAFKKALLVKTGGTEVTIATQQAYDNVKMLAHVFAKVGTDPDKVSAEMHKLKYDGVSGEISFDVNGDLTSSSYVFMVVRDGIAKEAK